MQIDQVHEPQRFEPHWARTWTDSGIFRGSMHIGHKLEHTEIDVPVRWRRMPGHNTLWLPGTDRAGIATQMAVERELAKRKELEKRVRQWKEQYGDRMERQMIGIVQEIVAMAGNLRTESKLDPKQQPSGAVCSRTGALEVAQRHADTTQKLANGKLEFQEDAAPKAPAIRSTAQIDPVLEVPESREESSRTRISSPRRPDTSSRKCGPIWAAYQAQRGKLL